jgi:hypothetical protein
MPVALGWLPNGFDHLGGNAILGNAKGWQATVSAFSGPPSQLLQIEVTIGTVADVLRGPSKPGFTPPISVAVRGVTGTIYTSGDQGVLWAPLPGGLGLRVDGTASQADLVHVTNSLRIGPIPDLSWLGAR